MRESFRRSFLVLVLFLFPSFLFSDTLPLQFPPELQKKYLSDLPIAVGSGLAYAGKDTNGGELFYVVTDSGPRSFDVSDDSLKKAVKQFKPLFGKIHVTKEEARVLWLREIISKKPIDPEGIAVSQEGELWIVEENSPSLILLDKESGEVRKRYKPGKGLPKVLKRRYPGRGLEGLTVTPSGDLVAIMQSPLDKKTEDSIRIIRFNPQTQETTQYRYSISTKSYDDIRIGAIEALSDDRFAILERTEENGIRSYDLKELTLEGEQVKARLIAPLENYKAQKLEGLAVLPSGDFMLVNDNDFGLEGPGDLKSDAKTYVYTVSR